MGTGTFFLLASDLASAGGFHGVHAGVGGADDGVKGGAVAGGGGDADAGSDLELQTVLHSEIGGHQGLEQDLSLGQPVCGAGFGHDDDELVAAIAEGEIDHAAFFFDGRSDFG